MTAELSRITDGAESPLPPLLRVSFVVVASSCVAYLILFMFGEAIGLLAAAFFVGVSIFAANGPQD